MRQLAGVYRYYLFTGSRTQSDANPGRCTDTGGYLSNAEIAEIIRKGDGAQTFHGGNSNTDVMLYKGDYVSYMTDTTKITRRSDWQGLNFAGTIDWVLDLQNFGADDMDIPPDMPTDASGNGCTLGKDLTVDTGDLCEFACNWGFCPETLCACVSRGPLVTLPPAQPDANIVALDEFNVDMNRLCKFACKYGYCPGEICVTQQAEEPEVDVVSVDNPDYYKKEQGEVANAFNCMIQKDPDPNYDGALQCYNVCKDVVDAAKAAGRITNYGCVGWFPGTGPIPWWDYPGFGMVAKGKCSCDNMLVNVLAETVLEAMPKIAQVCSQEAKNEVVMLDGLLANLVADRMLHGHVHVEDGAGRRPRFHPRRGEGDLGRLRYVISCLCLQSPPCSRHDCYDVANS